MGVGFGGKGSHLNADRRFAETDLRAALRGKPDYRVEEGLLSDRRNSRNDAG